MKRAPVPRRHPARNPRGGFTLVELMVSMSILILLLLITFATTDSVSTIHRRTRARIDTFQEARAGFETVTRRLSQAMLNTYWDYEYPNNDPTQAPRGYVRQSELHFVSGPTKAAGDDSLLPEESIQSTTHGLFFQAPLGFSSPTAGAVPNANPQNLLNAGGYFLEYTSDKEDRPTFLRESDVGPAERWRSRLMEFSQPTEDLLIYKATRLEAPKASSRLKPLDWFRKPLAQDLSTGPVMKRVMAENIVALVLWPHRSPHDKVPAGSQQQLAPDYRYDSRLFVTQSAAATADISRNQLPPMVQVTMVAIDETSAARLQERLVKPKLLPETELGLTDLFQRPSKSTSPTPEKEGEQYREDLVSFERKMNEAGITYRIFSTDVSILQAKWSEN